MKSATSLVIASPGLLLADAVLRPALAQAPAPSVAPATGSGGTIMAILLVVGLLVIIAVGVALIDLKRRRDAEAVHLQAQVSEAMLRDAALFGLPIVATARVPFWSGSPAAIDLSGQVPGEDHRLAALKIAREEATRLRPDVQIEDHVTVVPMAATRAA